MKLTQCSLDDLMTLQDCGIDDLEFITLIRKIDDLKSTCDAVKKRLDDIRCGMLRNKQRNYETWKNEPTATVNDYWDGRVALRRLTDRVENISATWDSMSFVRDLPKTT